MVELRLKGLALNHCLRSRGAQDCTLKAMRSRLMPGCTALGINIGVVSRQYNIAASSIAADSM